MYIFAAGLRWILLDRTQNFNSPQDLSIFVPYQFVDNCRKYPELFWAELRVLRLLVPIHRKILRNKAFCIIEKKRKCFIYHRCGESTSKKIISKSWHIKRCNKDSFSFFLVPSSWCKCSQKLWLSLPFLETVGAKKSTVAAVRSSLVCSSILMFGIQLCFDDDTFRIATKKLQVSLQFIWRIIISRIPSANFKGKTYTIARS